MQRIKKLGVGNLHFQMIISKSNFGEIINLPNKRADPNNQTGWNFVFFLHKKIVSRVEKHNKRACLFYRQVVEK